jgi:hypothetical protein
MLGLLAVMLAGSAMAATASAEAGPFWHHRAIGGEGAGSKIEPKAPENFRGTGGKTTLTTEANGTPIESVTKSSQVKGALFNNSLQGQAKIEIVLNQPELVKPALKECHVTINKNNIMVLKGHLMWKWNGTSEQLKEQPQKAQSPVLAYTVIEPSAQKPEPTEPINLTTDGTLSTTTLAGSGCGLMAGTFPTTGSYEYNLNRKLEEFSRKQTVYTAPGEEGITFEGKAIPKAFRAHYWNGTAFVGAILGPQFSGSPGNLLGQSESETEQQEVAIFEK